MNSRRRLLPPQRPHPSRSTNATPLAQERHSLRLLTAQGRVAPLFLPPLFLSHHPFLTCNRSHQRCAAHLHICHVRSVSIKGGKKAALTTGWREGEGRLGKRRCQRVLAHNETAALEKSKLS